MTEIIWTSQAPGIETATAKSAVEFLDVLRRSNPYWWEGEHSPWVFRGHADENWPLLPSAWRKENKVISASRAEATKRFDKVNPSQSLIWWLAPNFQTGSVVFSSDDAVLQRALAIESTAELLPVWVFSVACHELRLPTPL